MYVLFFSRQRENDLAIRISPFHPRSFLPPSPSPPSLQHMNASLATNLRQQLNSTLGRERVAHLMPLCKRKRTKTKKHEPSTKKPRENANDDFYPPDILDLATARECDRVRARKTLLYFLCSSKCKRGHCAVVPSELTKSLEGTFFHSLTLTAYYCLKNNEQHEKKEIYVEK